MRRNYRFGIGALLLIGALGYLVYAGVRQSAVYYLTIGEFVHRKHELAGREVRVAGRVVPGSVVKRVDASGTRLDFALYDFTGEQTQPDQRLAIHYVGIVPDMFAEGRDVIVEGHYDGSVLRARSVMTSCPSKYEPAEQGRQAEAGADS